MPHPATAKDTSSKGLVLAAFIVEVVVAIGSAAVGLYYIWMISMLASTFNVPNSALTESYTIVFVAFAVVFILDVIFMVLIWQVYRGKREIGWGLGIGTLICANLISGILLLVYRSSLDKQAVPVVVAPGGAAPGGAVPARAVPNAAAPEYVGAIPTAQAGQASVLQQNLATAASKPLPSGAITAPVVLACVALLFWFVSVRYDAYYMGGGNFSFDTILSSFGLYLGMFASSLNFLNLIPLMMNLLYLAALVGLLAFIVTQKDKQPLPVALLSLVPVFMSLLSLLLNPTNSATFISLFVRLLFAGALIGSLFVRNSGVVALAGCGVLSFLCLLLMLAGMAPFATGTGDIRIYLISSLIGSCCFYFAIATFIYVKDKAKALV